MGREGRGGVMPTTSTSTSCRVVRPWCILLGAALLLSLGALLDATDVGLDALVDATDGPFAVLHDDNPAMPRRLLHRGQDGGRPATTTRIIFGSCNKVELPQPLWPLISARKPDAFLWLGDNIYADHFPNVTSPRFTPTSEPRLRDLYTDQLANPGYKSLVDSGLPVLGTYDDHDFGINNGDRTNDVKDTAKDLFWDFLGEPKDSPIRQRQGTYHAHVFQVHEDFTLGVIFLDVRYHKDPWQTTDGTMLGEEQWAWLEATLASFSEARVSLTILASSIQVLPDYRWIPECWAKFPDERQKLMELTWQAAIPIVMLSGDVHFGEMNQATCDTQNQDGSDGNPQEGTQRAVEITSSGMTHTFSLGSVDAGQPVLEFLKGGVMWLYMTLMPFRFQVPSVWPDRARYTDQLNFGELDIDWKAGTVSARLRGLDAVESSGHEVRGTTEVGGRVLLEAQWDLASLSGTGETPASCRPLEGNPSFAAPWGSSAVCAAIVILVVFVLPFWAARRCWKLLGSAFSSTKDKRA